MTTATTTRTRPRKAKPADTCRLTLFVRGVAYAVRILETDPGAGVSTLIRLRKSDGESYHVAQTAHGATCDCGDQEWRHAGRDDVGCKHIRACRALGLLPRD